MNVRLSLALGRPGLAWRNLLKSVDSRPQEPEAANSSLGHWGLGHTGLAMVWYGMVWYGMVWYGMVWCDMVWCDGMVWYGMVWSAHGPVPVLPGHALLGALLVQPVPSLHDGRHEVVGSVAPPVVVQN